MGWKQSPFVLRCKAQILASPAKTGTLVGLGLLLLVIVAVQLLNSPSSATAAVDPTIEVVELIPTETLPGATPPPQQRPELPDLPDQLPRDLFAGALSAMGTGPVQGDANLDGLSADNQDDEPTWMLKATYLSYGDQAAPMAIIGGMMVREGDRLQRYVVESIDSRQVVLKDGSLRIVLRMP